MKQNPYDARAQQTVVQKLKIPRAGPHPQHRICDYCHVDILDGQTAKCGKCLLVRYCSPVCQSKDWKETHKATCKTPEPKVDHHVEKVNVLWTFVLKGKALEPTGLAIVTMGQVKLEAKEEHTLI